MDDGTAARITGLRRRVHAVVDKLAAAGPAADGGARRDALRRRANALLHEPTRRLREGQLAAADVEATAREIEEVLGAMD